MPAPAERRKPFESFTPLITDNEELNRVQQEIARLLNGLLKASFALGNFQVLSVTLIEGINKLTHGLGRAPAGFFLDVNAFGAFDRVRSAQAENPRPEQEVWVELDTGADVTVNLCVYVAPTRGRGSPGNPTGS